jgi:hypothetical protein
MERPRPCFRPTVCDPVLGTEWVVGFAFNSVKVFFNTKLSNKWVFPENRRRRDCSVHGDQKGIFSLLSVFHGRFEKIQCNKSPPNVIQQMLYS